MAGWGNELWGADPWADGGGPPDPPVPTLATPRWLPRLGGAGAEALGDPAGGGGPLHVIRARAVAGQVVRVVFDQPPKAQSAAGLDDGLNPANYSFAITVGSGTAPLPVGVDAPAIVGPAVAVAGPVVITAATDATPIVLSTLTPHGRFTGDVVTVAGAGGNTAANGDWTVTVVDALTVALDGSTGSGIYTTGGVVVSDERGLDVHVDRELIVGLSYDVTAHGIASAGGGGLGYPYTASFVGSVPLKQRSVQAIRASSLDFDNPPTTGAWRVDDSGDIAIAGGIASLKKRIWRRLGTPRGAFKWLPNYGVALALKETASLAQISAYKLDAKQQVAKEPEVASVAVQMTVTGAGVATVMVTARTKLGAVVEAGMQSTPNQGVVFL